MPTQQQYKLLRAIKQRDLKAARNLLNRGVDPDFADSTGTTPLHEAVRIRSLPLVKQLVKLGADVNFENQHHETPLDLARRLRETDIAFFFQQNRAKQKRMTPGAPVDDDDDGQDEVVISPQTAPVESAGQKPSFSKHNLKDIFNPAGWVGKTDEMEKLWQEVPKPLRKHFDFASALTEARRDTLRKNISPKKLEPPK